MAPERQPALLGVCWGQQQNSPKLVSLSPRNPVSPWPEFPSGVQRFRLRGATRQAPSVSRSDVELASSWSQQDEAGVAQLLVNLQELLGCGAGAHFILRAQLVAQRLHFTQQFLVVGVDLL